LVKVGAFRKDLDVRLTGIVIFLAGSLPQIARAQATPSEANIDRVGWLAGCWESRRGDRATVEMWMPPAGGFMLGASRSVAGGQLRAFEQLMLQEDAGQLIYTANPSGQAEASFTSTAVTDSSFTVENPAHDFPQKIEYWRFGMDSLVARVSGSSNSFEIPMRRIQCEI
jgi:hypothetical protein